MRARVTLFPRDEKGTPMNAIEIMEQDHQELKSSLARVMESPDRNKRELFSALKRQLELHKRLGEQVLYPAVKSHSKATDFHGRYRLAHEEMDQILGLLDGLSIGHKDWTPTFLAMQAKVLSHISDQESHLIQTLRSLLSPQELEALGKIMDLRKRFDLRHSSGPAVGGAQSSR